MSTTVCPECGCRCDVLAAGSGCALGRVAPLADAQAALVNGKPATLDEAVNHAAEILRAARYPLIFGVTNSTSESQRAAVALADRIGGCVDAGGSGGSPLFSEIGTVMCTLGELKKRADLIVYWGEIPTNSLPASANPSPTVVNVGAAATGDQSIPLAAGRDFAAFWLLRALVQERPIAADGLGVAGVPVETWRALADRLKRCKFGVLVLGASVPPRAVEAAHGLATDLNSFTRFYVLRPKKPGNHVGAEQVLTWQTGYPAAVGLHAGHPQSFAGEFAAERVLSRGEADAALLIGAAESPTFNRSAIEHLRRIPTVALSSRIAALPFPAAVAITTVACVGPHATAFRFDGLAVPLRPAISSSFPDEFQVLQRIEHALRRAAAPG
jgi:formylmethanofuran dehydrogenase subunit B